MPAARESAAGSTSRTEVLRVLIAGPLPPPEGGVATSIAGLRQAVGRTCELAVFNTSTHGPVHRAGLWSAANVFGAVQQAFRLRQEVRLHRPDVVHVETGGYLGVLKSALLMLAVRGTPTVLSMHSPHLDRDLRSATPVGALLIRAALRRARAIRVEHRGQRDQLLDADPELRTTAVYTIPNVVALPAPSSDPRPVRPDDGVIRVISVGAMGHRKGTYDLIEALAELRAEGVAITCEIVGPQEREGDRVALELLRERAGLEDDVTFMGELDNEEVRNRLRQADVFVLPAYAEGLPLAILEAMAAGLPVVATDVGGIGEALKQPEVPVLDPGDVPGLARALSGLAEDPELRRRCSEANREQMATTLRADALGAQFQRMWCDVAGAPRRHAPAKRWARVRGAFAASPRGGE